jgi:hypothetical protein
VEARGGRCEWPGCTWVRNLVWHHKDPSTKKQNIKKAVGETTTGELERELAKCILLCPNHHAMADEEVQGKVK